MNVQELLVVIQHHGHPFDICSEEGDYLHYQVSQGITNRALTAWANERFSTSVTEMTINRILKNQSLFARKDNERPEAKIIRKIVSPIVEEATYKPKVVTYMWG